MRAPHAAETEAARPTSHDAASQSIYTVYTLQYAGTSCTPLSIAIENFSARRNKFTDRPGGRNFFGRCWRAGSVASRCSSSWSVHSFEQCFGQALRSAWSLSPHICLRGASGRRLTHPPPSRHQRQPSQLPAAAALVVAVEANESSSAAAAPAAHPIFSWMRGSAVNRHGAAQRPCSAAPTTRQAPQTRQTGNWQQSWCQWHLVCRSPMGLPRHRYRR